MGRRFLPGVIKSLVLGDHFAIQEICGIGASFGTSGEGTNLNQHASTATGNIIIDILMYFSRIYSFKKKLRTKTCSKVHVEEPTNAMSYVFMRFRPGSPAVLADFLASRSEDRVEKDAN